MTPEALRKWRGNRSQRRAAADIGYSIAHYQKMEDGRVAIELRAALACEGWTARQAANFPIPSG